jgi:protein gp37
MGDGTAISWSDATWNPTVGCTKVSPGCDRCYAETLVNRFAPSKGFPERFDTVTDRGGRFLDLPLTWKKPRKVFVNSLSDLFHTDIPDGLIINVFAVMALAPQHTFQLLTKRHGRMRSLLTDPDFHAQVTQTIVGRVVHEGLDDTHLVQANPDWWPLRNVWLGVSVENQHWGDIRIPALLATPAALRWISAEPLIGPLDLREYLHTGPHSWSADASVDWVVVGGESGPGARPMHPDWPRRIAAQCASAGVPWHMKQWGEWAPGSNEPGANYRQCLVAHTGETVEPPSALWTTPAAYQDGINRMDWAYVHRAGRARAGHLLDGHAHQDFP